MYHDLKTFIGGLVMKRDIADTLARCLTSLRESQHQNPQILNNQKYLIPEWKWEKITMDLVIKLPRSSSGYDAIWNDVPSYTQRIHELTLICTKLCANETEKVDKYVCGLPDNIYRNVKSSKTLDETIELANDLMDQKLRTIGKGTFPEIAEYWQHQMLLTAQMGNEAALRECCFECGASDISRGMSEVKTRMGNGCTRLGVIVWECGEEWERSREPEL
ncbi:hypothetical protein Tco_1113479 [Tanacetum coccineum]|uniref:Uncharacterized protein n=1 Tax=Tanacetum coccineum TaxID=301880 RepID=A0ABQ5ITH3_9ASTR